jgi:HK97 family phage major capsid protein
MDLQINEKDGKMVLNTEALEAAIREGTVNTVKDQVKELVKSETKAIFDNSDGRIMDKEGKSVIDTGFFNKTYSSGRRGVMDGAALGDYLGSNGGPFLRLSPIMEKFANLVRKRFDPRSLLVSGFNLSEWNKEIVDWNKKGALSGTLVEGDVGAIVPIEFLATVIEFAIEQSKILPKLWRIPMGAYQTRIPYLSQAAGSYFGGILLKHPDEAYEKESTKPTFSYKTFEAKKLIGLIPISDELVMDSSINIINYLTGLFTRAFQYATEGEVVAGTGASGQMLGIISDPAINAVKRITLNTVKRDDIINLESALDENFQDINYLTRRATLNVLRKEKTTTGAPIYYDTTESGLQPGMGPQLNGYPVIRTRNVPAIGNKGDVVCGELGYYIWAIRQDMTIDMSSERYFEYDVKAIRFVVRQDGAPGVSIAFSILSNIPETS